MKKKFLIILVSFFLTGCWNYKELNSLAIYTSMAIDLTNDGQYEVSLLVANSKKNQGSSKDGESQTIVYSAVGDTISEAINNIDLENPRQTYIGHLSVIIISEEIAYNGLINTLDLLLRSSESTKRFFLAIARGNKAKEIIEVLTPLETFSSQSISTNIKSSSESQAMSSAVMYSKFVEDILKKGINPILPSIIIEGNAEDGSKQESLQQTVPEAMVKLDKIALFKDDKLLGYSKKDESRGINLMLGLLKEMLLELKEDDGLTVVKATEIVSIIRVEIKDGVPSATVSVNAAAQIIENTRPIDLNDPDVISKIENDTNKEMKKLMKKGLVLAQKELNSDFIGFGNMIYKKDPKYYNSISDWDKDVFPYLDVNIKVNISLNSKGSTKQSIKEAKNEN